MGMAPCWNKRKPAVMATQALCICSYVNANVCVRESERAGASHSPSLLSPRATCIAPIVCTRDRLSCVCVCVCVQRWGVCVLSHTPHGTAGKSKDCACTCQERTEGKKGSEKKAHKKSVKPTREKRWEKMIDAKLVLESLWELRLNGSEAFLALLDTYSQFQLNSYFANVWDYP